MIISDKVIVLLYCEITYGHNMPWCLFIIINFFFGVKDGNRTRIVGATIHRTTIVLQSPSLFYKATRKKWVFVIKYLVPKCPYDGSNPTMSTKYYLGYKLFLLITYSKIFLYRYKVYKYPCKTLSEKFFSVHQTSDIGMVSQNTEKHSRIYMADASRGF